MARSVANSSLESLKANADLIKQKNEEKELTEEEKLTLIIMDRQIPRTKCVQISPAVAKIPKLRQHIRHVRYSHMQNILNKASYIKKTTDPSVYKIPNTFYSIDPKLVVKHMKHITEFDKSESIIPHGEISKKLYLNITARREFNLYGGDFQREKMSDKEEQELAFVARRMGLDYIKASVEEQTTKHEIRHIDVYGLKGIEDLKRPLITTPLYRIGIKECYHPPVGFASNPIGELNSEGNEKYYSYDGAWRNGQMHGYGYYLFEDGGTYEGEYYNNWAHGEGTSKYVIYRHEEKKKEEKETETDQNPISTTESTDGQNNSPEEKPNDSNQLIENKSESLTHLEDTKDKKAVAIVNNIENQEGSNTQMSENLDTKNKDDDNQKEEEEEEKNGGDNNDDSDSDSDSSYSRIKNQLGMLSHKYTGQWRKGKMHGMGRLSLSSGTYYDGEFKDGKKEGLGKIVYISGLEYEGQLMDGKPHGRGVMYSNLTGYTYDGYFHNGSIQGTGTLITPPPDNKRVVRYWRESSTPVLLPEAVRIYLKEVQEQALADKIQENNIYGARRAASLRDYIAAVRQDIQIERTRIKKQQAKEAQEKMRLRMIQLKEAKLRALTGEEG